MLLNNKVSLSLNFRPAGRVCQYDSCNIWSVDKPNAKIMGKVQFPGENSLPLSDVKIKYG